ncbi:hypothetical protein O7621_04010 [Solwaraspora sp. WMMD937]|uniref:hypothetical protein n=1 Tax=Solwaraspora sp. WMMD937 TaxID=3016090 RepID=UPI00249C26D3|nr:hypothetical protein [Solwaraspora sp. WMMD937]WFE22522.1 hypothetical protein O7621_04010 [Solwaraspora sp. WMMD937]
MTGPLSIVPPTGLHTAGPEALGDVRLRAGGDGMVVGRNRQGGPVAVRLFRPEPTRLLLVGGLRCAQLLALRAMALGAYLFIQTAREPDWRGFLHQCGLGQESASFLPPGAQPPPPPSPAHPQLLAVDVGPAMGGTSEVGVPWRTTMVVRNDMGSWDLDPLVRSDLVVLQRLTAAEAALVASALGFTEAQSWLTRIHPEMVGLVSQGRLQWVMLHPTSMESALLGPVGRP